MISGVRPEILSVDDHLQRTSSDGGTEKRVSGSKECVEVFEATRPSQMEALAIANTKVHEYGELSCSLYPFGIHFSTNLLTKGDKRPGESAPNRV